MKQSYLKLLHFTLTHVLLFALFSSPAVFAEATSSADLDKNGSTAIYRHKTPDATGSNSTVSSEIKQNDKKILIEESREMSSFFKLGIAINVVMILVFAWWFRKEWRSRK